jgi:integrase
MLRAEILRGEVARAEAPNPSHVPATHPPGVAYLPTPTVATSAPAAVYLRDVFDKWVEAKPRSADTVAACKRAVVLYEEQTGNPPLSGITRAAGIAFRTWLQQPARGTTSKTARDRLTWVKSLLKHAHIELELIPRSPWEGLDIEQITAHRRRPWTSTELDTFFGAPLHTHFTLPVDQKAGREAAYWIPLLGLYSGARISELVQLRRRDIEVVEDIYVMSVTDEGEHQQVKTSASVRKVPLHSELIRLGFIEYVQRVAPAGDDPLWPAVPMREGKAGGYFSQWFGTYRRGFGFGRYPDFHCLRHTVRSALANAEVVEPMIDTLLGHEVKGSTGAKVYTHRTITQMKAAIEKITYPTLKLVRVRGAS